MDYAGDGSRLHRAGSSADDGDGRNILDDPLAATAKSEAGAAHHHQLGSPQGDGGGWGTRRHRRFERQKVVQLDSFEVEQEVDGGQGQGGADDGDEDDDFDVTTQSF